MSKSKQKIGSAADTYVSELEAKFPFLHATAVFEPFYGYDFTVDVKIPSEDDEAFEDVIRATVDLNFRIWDEQGISAVAFVTEKEPVHG